MLKSNIPSKISATFHGRDIFAPVAAHISKGTPIENVGQKISDFGDLDFGKCGVDGAFLVGEVIYTDSFGNVITNIPESMILSFSSFGSQVEVNGRPCPFVQTYGFVREKEALILIGSHGFLEIAVNGGNAALQFGLKNADSIAIKIL